jgi:hypothetical protein
MSDDLWILGVRAAGVFHFVTLVLAGFTPIPPNWDENLSRLPEIHHRFAVAQNFFIGAVIAACGAISLAFAPDLIAGSKLARVICAGIALWWGGRIIVLQWLRVWPNLPGTWWRIGFILLQIECVVYALAFGWLAMRSR